MFAYLGLTVPLVLSCVISSSIAFICTSLSPRFVSVFQAGLSVSRDSPLRWSAVVIALALLFCLLGRAVNVFPLSVLLNCCRRAPIPFKMQICIWFAGLRGACAFALSMKVPGVVFRSYVQSTTMAIVLLTTIVGGGLTETVVRSLRQRGVDMLPEPDKPIESLHDHELVLLDEDELGTNGEPVVRFVSDRNVDVEENHQSGNRRTGFAKWWHSVDNKYIKKWFGGRDSRQRGDSGFVENASSLSGAAHGHHNPGAHVPLDRAVRSSNEYIPPVAPVQSSSALELQATNPHS